jgi:hypothetical protein
VERQLCRLQNPSEGVGDGELLSVRGKPPPFRNTLPDYVNNSGRAETEDFQSWTRVREPGTPKPNLAAPGSI